MLEDRDGANDMCKLYEVTMDVERHSVDTSGICEPINHISFVTVFYFAYACNDFYDMILLSFDFRQL